MKTIRFGIVGAGNMANAHANWLREGKVNRAEFAAICDSDPARLSRHGDVATFTDHKALLNSGKVDAVLIATPHYSHTTIGIDALNAGLHVLVEKPISVHKADCERLIAAYRARPQGQVFAAMFNQRTDPHYTKMRDLIRAGELGAVRRVNWIITNWFRTQAYYASGGWRATWAGEGGGVLLNQCPHNLDLFQWLFGMPARVRAFCQMGRFHDIEVEDDVTAYMEFPDGATGVFITSTGEAPGTNRLEVAAERGRVVLEGGKIQFTRNEVEMTQFSRTCPHGFATPGTWNVEIPVSGSGDQHVGIMNNFVNAILDGAPLIAPAEEGIHSVELANAMLLSSQRKATVELPLDGSEYEAVLKRWIEESRFQKKVATDAAPAEMAGSFAR